MILFLYIFGDKNMNEKNKLNIEFNELLLSDLYQWNVDSKGNFVINHVLDFTPKKLNHNEVSEMLYEDKNGKLMMSEEVEELFAWEIVDKEIQASKIDAWS